MSIRYFVQKLSLNVTPFDRLTTENIITIVFKINSIINRAFFRLMFSLKKYLLKLGSGDRFGILTSFTNTSRQISFEDKKQVKKCNSNYSNEIKQTAVSEIITYNLT